MWNNNIYKMSKTMLTPIILKKSNNMETDLLTGSTCREIVKHAQYCYMYLPIGIYNEYT